MPSALRRAGAAICVSLLAASVLSGCAQKKATPAPSANPTVAFAKSAELTANLAALDQVSGSVQGTMTVGTTNRTLSGTVSLNGKSSQIMMVEGGATQEVLDEIVVADHRYTSRDDKTWIDRGTEAAGADLKSLLATADTALDSGISKIGTVSGHKILTAPDKVDLAIALGIDIWTFDEETTTLRIWSDDTGKPIGFGGSMSWKQTIGGVSTDVTVELDVMFNTAAPADIEAPENPWQWIEDKPTGIALAIPADWKPTDVNKDLGLTTYYDSASGTNVAFMNLGDAGTATVTQVSDAIVAKINDKPSAAQSVVIGSEDARWMSVHRSAQNDYEVVAIVVHETLAYEILVVGEPADENAVDAQALQIFSDIEFTR
jgi:outer membrane lipoprotein-sorting protein